MKPLHYTIAVKSEIMTRAVPAMMNYEEKGCILLTSGNHPNGARFIISTDPHEELSTLRGYLVKLTGN